MLDSDTGDPVFAVRYDGFGRVAQRRAPWPDNNPNLTKQRIETYFYDGVRRIQEVFTDPIDAIPPWTIDPGDMPLYTGGNSHRTEAEFVWSAASGQPFDTCHVQIDWWDREAWFVQDHQAGRSSMATGGTPGHPRCESGHDAGFQRAVHRRDIRCACTEYREVVSLGGLYGRLPALGVELTVCRDEIMLDEIKSGSMEPGYKLLIEPEFLHGSM